MHDGIQPRPVGPGVDDGTNERRRCWIDRAVLDVVDVAVELQIAERYSVEEDEDRVEPEAMFAANASPGGSLVINAAASVDGMKK